MSSIDKRRRTLLATAVAAAATPLPMLARAQAFPQKPITLLVPFPAGGGTDVQMRALAQAASKVLRQPVVVVNQPGVSGTMAPAAMARTAAPDGHTVSAITATLFRLPHVQKVNYDPIADFSYIIGLTNYSFGIVVAPDAPWKTLPEFIAALKASPDKYSVGAIGHGGSSHIAILRLARAAGFKLNYVPYKGASEVLQAVLGGHLDAMAEAGWGNMVDAGKLRLLALMDEERSARWPEAPTLKDLGYDIAARSQMGIVGPKGMDPQVMKVLHDAFRTASADPQYQKSLEALGQPNTYMSSEAFRSHAIAQTASDKRFIDELGLRLNP